MKGELYKVTNIYNGKMYIGKTYIGYLNRWKRHVQDYLRNDRNINTKFANAVRKYGENAFEIEVILEAEEGSLEQKEIEYIQMYDTYYNGYNSTLGGDGNTIIDIDEQYVVELFKSGVSLNKIAKEVGTKTTRTISSIIKKHGLKVERQTAAEVYQYSLDGKLIQKFNSKMDAWRWLVMNYKEDIKKSTAYFYIKKSNDTGGIAFGFKWKQIDSNRVNEGKTENFNKYTYYCNVYNKSNYLVFEDAKVSDVAKYLVNNGLTNTDDVKYVRSLIVSINKGWLYNLYFEVYRLES